MIKQNKEFKLLYPKKEVVRARGILSYDEGQQSWSIIRLKKEIKSEFPQLKEKSRKFGYMMNFYKSFKDLKKDIKELEKKGNIVPMLLMLGEEKNSG